MSVFYRVRVKIFAPDYKGQFIDGLYVARDIVADLDAAKRSIAHQTRQRLNSPNAVVEVVLFRRSDIGFILSESSEELDEK